MAKFTLVKDALPVWYYGENDLVLILENFGEKGKYHYETGNYDPKLKKFFMWFVGDYGLEKDYFRDDEIFGWMDIDSLELPKELL